MRLIRVVHDTETITAGVDVLIRNDLVAGDVDVTLDLGFLQHSYEVGYTNLHGRPYRFVLIPHPIQMRPLQDEVPHLPAVVLLALLA